MSQALEVELANFQFWMCWYPCNAKGFEGDKLSNFWSALQKLMVLLIIYTIYVFI